MPRRNVGNVPVQAVRADGSIGLIFRSARMNGWQISGSGKGGVNGWKWVTFPSTASRRIADINAIRQLTRMYRSNSMAHRTKFGILAGAAMGAVIAVPALLAAIVSGGAGHGSYIAARVLFPFSMLLTRLEGSIGPIALGVGLLQFPLYGALIGRTMASKRCLSLFLLAAMHLVAALACFSGLLSGFL